MVAFHFPPLTGSTGLLRTLKFSRYLLDFGWKPIVLTAHDQCYPVRSNSSLPIPDDVQVIRAWGLDAQQHLAIGGRYFKWLALPDRWLTWWLGAMKCGLRLIRRQNPRVIWSTYPIATAHLIGLALSKVSGIPLVADFRDPMTEDNYPEDSITRILYRWIEKKTIHHCRIAVFTTRSALRDYTQKYRSAAEEKFKLIPNGYDDEDFYFPHSGNECRQERSENRKIQLVHSGLLYPSERDPRMFFEAVAELRETAVSPAQLKIIFRASGHEQYFLEMTTRMNLEEIVEFRPSVSYTEALREMMLSDGLLIFQASNCNSQIPAKTYEYLRAQRPILGIVDPIGDTAKVLEEVGNPYIAHIHDKDQIKATLLRFFSDFRLGHLKCPTLSDIEKYSRKHQAMELAKIFETLL